MSTSHETDFPNSTGRIPPPSVNFSPKELASLQRAATLRSIDSLMECVAANLRHNSDGFNLNTPSSESTSNFIQENRDSFKSESGGDCILNLSPKYVSCFLDVIGYR